MDPSPGIAATDRKTVKITGNMLKMRTRRPPEIKNGTSMTAAEKDEKKTRIVYMGTPVPSALILEGLLEQGWNVVAVVTQPDRPRGRGRKVTPSPVKETAQAAGIPVLQPGTVKEPGFEKELSDLGAELIVTAAFGRLLPPRVLVLPRFGSFNVHFSLLPAYRGPGPVQRAILNGDRETGITLFRMEHGIDTGPVADAASLVIGPDDTAGSLTRRLAELARDAVPEAMGRIVRGEAALTPQDHSLATYAPMLQKEEGRIGWHLGAEEIHNRVRGLSPWPGAFTFWKGKRVRIWEADVEPVEPGGEPGEMAAVSPEGIRVRTGKDVLVVRSLQMEGKKRADAADFLRGNPLKAGERFNETP